VCRKIDKNTCRSYINIDCFTNGFPDRLLPSVFHRELEKNYGLVPHFPMASPTDWETFQQEHRRNISVGISQRVRKQLRACATISDGITDGLTDRNHTSRSAHLSEALLPTALPAAQFPTVISVGITDG